jgi:amino acid transporter
MSEETCPAGTRAIASAGTPSSDHTLPPRVMGFADLLMFYVVTGISLRWIATAASAGPSSIVVWACAWIFFYVPLALSVVELSSRYPEEGGLYVWSKRAFGDFSGFMSGWTYWTSNLSYFPSVFYFAASNVLFLGGSRTAHLSSSKAYYMLFALGVLGLITVINVVGLSRGKWLHNVASFAMWVPVLILAVMGLYVWKHFGAATSFSQSTLVPQLHLKNLLVWASITFALCGCETASVMGGEIKDPRRNLPRALMLAGLVVTFCYIGGTVAILVALPGNEVSDLQGIMQAIAKTAGRLGWFTLIPVSAALIALSNLGAASAFLASVGRVPFVAGIDRFLPASFGKLHPRWGTPHVSLMTLTLVASVLIFLGQAGTTVRGAYDVLVSMSIIGAFIPYLYVFASMFKIQDQPAPDGVFRVPGGRPVARVVAGVGFATTLMTIVASVLPAPEEANKLLAVGKIVGFTGLLLGTGGLLYFLARRHRLAALPATAIPQSDPDEL